MQISKVWCCAESVQGPAHNSFWCTCVWWLLTFAFLLCLLPGAAQYLWHSNCGVLPLHLLFMM